MKILVTGGCGFLGSNLAAHVFHRTADELAVLDNLARTGSEQNLKWLRSQGDFAFHQVDVRVAAEVDRVVAATRPDVIFHLAGQVAMTTSIANPRLDFETNALGTLNVLEAVRRHGPETIVIYSSTNKVYGDLEWARYDEQSSRYVAPDFPEGFPETIPLEFHSPYGCSKGAADQYMLDAHRMFGLRTVVFRHSSMYGGRQFATYDQGWIGWFCQQALDVQKHRLRKPFTISGNGKQVRDVLHADDMVALYFAAVAAIDKAAGQVFNIGGSMTNSLSLLELFQLLEREMDVRLEPTLLPPRTSDQKVFVADIRKARERLGWLPKIDKLTGIRRMIEWVTTMPD